MVPDRGRNLVVQDRSAGSIGDWLERHRSAFESHMTETGALLLRGLAAASVEDDGLVLDNVSWAHGRNPYRGRRAILVAMGSMHAYAVDAAS